MTLLKKRVVGIHKDFQHLLLVRTTNKILIIFLHFWTPSNHDMSNFTQSNGTN